MSFNKIDEIALNMGIEEDDDRRIKALIIYVMKETCFNRGDTYLKLEDIKNILGNRQISISREISASMSGLLPKSCTPHGPSRSESSISFLVAIQL